MRGPRSGRARDGDGPVGEMSDSCQNAGQHAGQQPPSRSGGWPHQCITPSNQRSDPVAGVWVPVAVEEEEAVRSSRMTAWRQVARLGSICTLEFFLQSGANCRISIIQTLTNTRN